jgi:L-ascorbate metabolism protein UlaG (beta-lactamase superfamily)
MEKYKLVIFEYEHNLRGLVHVFRFTFFGYGAVLLQLEKHLLFNPGVIEGSPLVDTSTVTPSYILVSHPSRELLGNAHEFPQKQGSIIIGTAQVIEQSRKAGVQGYSLEEMKDDKTIDLGGNIELTGYLIKHHGFLASRGLVFAVKSAQGCLVYLGKAIEVGPFKDAEPDLLCVPVGGKPYGTIDPEEAISLTQAIGPRYALPICGSEEHRKQYIEILTSLASGILPIDIPKGETFTLL